MPRCGRSARRRPAMERSSGHGLRGDERPESAQLPALRLRARRGPCFSPRMNHALILEALAAAYPDRECIVTPTRRLTYARVADHMRRLASVLHAHGLGCRRERAELANYESGQDHVGFYLLNCPEYIEGMLGCYRARSAPFNVNYRYVDDELCYLFDDADAVAVVYHARYAPTLEALVAEAEPGVVMRSMPVPPLMHGAAQWVAFGAIHKGGTVVMQGNPEKLDPDDIWGTVERERVSTLAIVGDAFARPLLDGLDRKRYDLSRLFVIGSGGAILSPHNKQAFLERLPHVTVVDGFGASETGAQGSHASRGGEAISTGTFSMAGAVVLKQDFSGFVEPGAEEIGWVGRAGHVPLGYYKDAAKTARTFPVVGGTRYAVPGDHARLLADGTIVVLGRGSVSINTGGEKVYAEEVEQVLRRHPAVYDAVVVGTPDERFGERVTAVVQPRSGARPSAEELVAFAAQHLARYKLPKTTVLVDEMVRSPSGKPDYRWARARALEARGLPAG